MKIYFVKLFLNKSDIFGALASTLCVIHCIATPFLFLAHSSTVSSNGSGLLWWKNLDYIFLIISFFAVARSAKNTSKSFMKLLLWVSWTALFLFILNEKIALFTLPETTIYITAIILAVLHMYNLKFCQCNSDRCCAHDKLKS